MVLSNINLFNFFVDLLDLLASNIIIGDKPMFLIITTYWGGQG